MTLFANSFFVVRRLAYQRPIGVLRLALHYKSRKHWHTNELRHFGRPRENQDRENTVGIGLFFFFNNSVSSSKYDINSKIICRSIRNFNSPLAPTPPSPTRLSPAARKPFNSNDSPRGQICLSSRTNFQFSLRSLFMFYRQRSTCIKRSQSPIGPCAAPLLYPALSCHIDSDFSWWTEIL